MGERDTCACMSVRMQCNVMQCTVVYVCRQVGMSGMYVFTVGM